MAVASFSRSSVHIVVYVRCRYIQTVPLIEKFRRSIDSILILYAVLTSYRMTERACQDSCTLISQCQRISGKSYRTMSAKRRHRTGGKRERHYSRAGSGFSEKKQRVSGCRGLLLVWAQLRAQSLHENSDPPPCLI
jgi:hypothetical protein